MSDPRHPKATPDAAVEREPVGTHQSSSSDMPATMMPDPVIGPEPSQPEGMYQTSPTMPPDANAPGSHSSNVGVYDRPVRSSSPVALIIGLVVLLLLVVALILWVL